MKNQAKPPRWVMYALLAFVGALIGASLMTGYDCKVGTTDQCLMSKGIFPLYLAALFLLLWPLIAAVGSAMRDPKQDADS